MPHTALPVGWFRIGLPALAANTVPALLSAVLLTVLVGPLLRLLPGNVGFPADPLALFLGLFAVCSLVMFALLGLVYRPSSVNFDTRQVRIGRHTVPFDRVTRVFYAPSGAGNVGFVIRYGPSRRLLAKAPVLRTALLELEPYELWVLARLLENCPIQPEPGYRRLPSSGPSADRRTAAQKRTDYIDGAVTRFLPFGVDKATTLDILASALAESWSGVDPLVPSRQGTLTRALATGPRFARALGRTFTPTTSGVRGEVEIDIPARYGFFTGAAGALARDERVRRRSARTWLETTGHRRRAPALRAALMRWLGLALLFGPVLVGAGFVPLALLTDALSADVEDLETVVIAYAVVLGLSVLSVYPGFALQWLGSVLGRRSLKTGILAAADAGIELPREATDLFQPPHQEYGLVNHLVMVTLPAVGTLGLISGLALIQFGNADPDGPLLVWGWSVVVLASAVLTGFIVAMYRADRVRRALDYEYLTVSRSTVRTGAGG